MNHTRGPWIYSHEQGDRHGKYKDKLRRWRIDSQTRGLMLTAEAWNTFNNDPDSWNEVECNVRLAAASPDLLEALEGIVEYGLYDTYDTCIGSMDEPNKYFKMAIKAIKKARGVE